MRHDWHCAGSQGSTGTSNQPTEKLDLLDGPRYLTIRVMLSVSRSSVNITTVIRSNKATVDHRSTGMDQRMLREINIETTAYINYSEIKRATREVQRIARTRSPKPRKQMRGNVNARERVSCTDSRSSHQVRCAYAVYQLV
jgi:hypothetical protein